jgi:hypothetical protein
MNKNAELNRLIFNHMLTLKGLVRLEPTTFYLDTVMPPKNKLTQRDVGYRSLN